MALDYPQPFKLEVDNQAAEVFINDTAFKSKLKHIDCRQEWVCVHEHYLKHTSNRRTLAVG